MDHDMSLDPTAVRFREAARTHWHADPAGSNSSSEAFRTREYFEEVEAHRYGTHPWIRAAISGFDVADKDVLEIGYGLGTDHLNLARGGGRMAGVDLAEASREATAQRLRLYGHESDLRIAPAEDLPFPDDSFDFVYSFGVIHHAADMGRIVDEIHRVLRPGGRCWVAVYHKWSIHFLWSILLVDWILGRGFRRETLAERVSRVEYPNDDPGLMVHLSGRRDFVRLFGTFSSRRASIEHIRPEDVSYLGSRIPQATWDRLGKRFGWYLIVEAVK